MGNEMSCGESQNESSRHILVLTIEISWSIKRHDRLQPTSKSGTPRLWYTCSP